MPEYLNISIYIYIYIYIARETYTISSKRVEIFYTIWSKGMEKFWSGGVKTFFSPTNNAKAIGKIDKYF